MSTLHVRSTVHMTAPQILSPKAASIQNMLVGSYHHLKGDECTFVPFLLLPLWSISRTAVGPTKLVRRKYGDHCTPKLGAVQMQNRAAPSSTQLRSQRGSQFPPGIHWLLSFVGWFWFQAPVLAPLLPLKAHSCLHPKLNYSLCWFGLWRGTLFCSLGVPPNLSKPICPQSLKPGTVGAGCLRDSTYTSQRLLVHNLPWPRVSFYVREKGGEGYPQKNWPTHTASKCKITASTWRADREDPTDVERRGQSPRQHWDFHVLSTRL